ncbi:MAG: 6-bladed beta-propeller [Gemmatimonadota bacterium]
MPSHTLVLSLCVLVGMTGCAKPRSLPATGEASQVFEEVSRVELDTSVVATIGRINDVLVLEDQILVADRTTDRVVAFDRDGTFVRAIGRRGSGPGEFRTPTALLEDADGTILVSQLNNRLTRLTPDLELIDVYETDVSTFIADLAMLGTQVLLFDGSYRADGDNYILWDHGSGREGTFDPRKELSQVPYWNAAWSTHIAVGPRHVFVADNMAYPIRRYTLDRQFVDTVGTAPMSWSQARQPALGEFATPGQQGAQEWLRSFTVIDDLFVVGGEWLIVTHRERVNEYPTEDLIRADVYRLTPSFHKVWTDIPLPGPILAGGPCAWVLAAVPPSPWTLACWRLRPGP